MIKKTAIALAVTSLSTSAFALSPSVGDPGFSGHVDLGVGGGRAESNFVSETFGIDVSDEQHNGLFNEPEDKGMLVPGLGYELGWTFSGGNSRIFLADDAQGEMLEFDPRTEIGFRYDSGVGNFQVSGLMSSGETKVYSDPYQSGKRGDTEYTNNGARLTWDQAFGTGLEVIIEGTEIDVDEERSGNSLGLSGRDRNLLQRDGDVLKASVRYLFDLGRGYALRPSLGYVDYDLDGNAMSRKGPQLGLAYEFSGDSIGLGLEGKYAKLDGDERNPIYGKKNDTDSYSIGGIVSFPGLFGWDNWVPSVSAAYAKDDSDIDFNTSEAWVGSVSFYRAF